MNLRGGDAPLIFGEEVKMKVAITALEPNLDSQIDPRFGRAKYFIIVDLDTMAYKVIENEGVKAASGAGTLAAQKIIDEGVSVVCSGDVGPHAREVIESSGIKIVHLEGGSVRDAIEKIKGGNL